MNNIVTWCIFGGKLLTTKFLFAGIRFYPKQKATKQDIIFFFLWHLLLCEQLVYIYIYSQGLSLLSLKKMKSGWPILISILLSLRRQIIFFTIRNVCIHTMHCVQSNAE
jgi:hypothetical protein